MVYNYFARMVKEECDDDSVLGGEDAKRAEGVAGEGTRTS
jgi:hypothetical protein